MSVTATKGNEKWLLPELHELTEVWRALAYTAAALCCVTLVLGVLLVEENWKLHTLKERVTELERCQWQAAPVPPAQKMTGGE